MHRDAHALESWRTRCTIWLPVASFTSDLDTGRPRSNCRACALAATKAWRAVHRGEIRARQAERYAAARAVGMTSYEASKQRDGRAVNAPKVRDIIREGGLGGEA
jgi:hypothetical protein